MDFRLDMNVLENKEKLRDFLTHIANNQTELQDKVSELHAKLESLETDLRYILDKRAIQ